VAHTLLLGEMPMHNHVAVGSSNPASVPSPTGNLWAKQSTSAYAPTANTPLNPAAIANNGSGQAHDNMPPYLVLNFCIALQGIFPTRN
jgi:microcystin-dependent protein